MPDSLIELVRLRKSLPAPPMRRAIRQAAGISEAALAASIGVTRAAVHNWETGRRFPHGDNLRRYAEVLGQLQDEAQR